jgi:Flp pilus assembly protein TadG
MKFIGVWRSLWDDETGAMTVDFIVWLPLFVSLLVIVSDASILYLTQTEMWNVARDTVRRMTTQQLTSNSDARCWAKAKLNLYSYLAYDVEATSTTDMNSVVIKVALSDASAFGYFLGPVLGETISARVTMRANPELTNLPEGAACAAGGGGGKGGGKESKK